MCKIVLKLWNAYFFGHQAASSTPDNLLFNSDTGFDQFMALQDCFLSSSQTLPMPWC